jgi:hypothetical protein
MYNLLDRSIAYDLLTIVIYLVLPLTIISSPLLSGFVFVATTTLTSEYATMPDIDPSIVRGPMYSGPLGRLYSHFPSEQFPYNSLVGKRKLEIVANVLSREGDSKKTALSQVFNEYIAADKKLTKEIWDEGHRCTIILDKNAAPYQRVDVEHRLITNPHITYFKDWLFKDGPIMPTRPRMEIIYF